MRNVRPNVAGRPAGLRLAGCAVVLAAACSSHDATKDAAVADSAPPARATMVPSAYVSNIPAWPVDTGTSSTDRDGALPEPLRAQVPSCGATAPVVTADSIGPFYPGQPLANLFGACSHVLQLWHWDDGKYAPALALQLGGALLLLDASGVAPDAVVTRVTALSGARTAEGIGAGSALADVQRAYGAPTWRRDQCAIGAAFASRPGLVVHIAIPESRGDSYTCEDIRRFGTGADFARFPRGSTVAWVAAELDAEQ